TRRCRRVATIGSRCRGCRSPIAMAPPSSGRCRPLTHDRAIARPSSSGGAVSDRIRVSIVTPFLNAERFIAESVESVLAQTYRDWELLLVDDGSSDGSPAIAARYATAHPQKIRCLGHDGRRNRGASASRNLGIALARGEYIAFLDADDVYLPPKLAEQVPVLDAHPDIAMTYAGTEYWHSWTGRAGDVAADWTWRNYGVEP